MTCRAAPGAFVRSGSAPPAATSERVLLARSDKSVQIFPGIPPLALTAATQL
jgi:hypothetical protein